jgi:hypothetical protein
MHKTLNLIRERKEKKKKHCFSRQGNRQPQEFVFTFLLHQSDKLLYKQALPSQPISEAQRF